MGGQQGKGAGDAASRPNRGERHDQDDIIAFL
jgi:hypothetical protein